MKPTAHVKSLSEVNVKDYVRNLRTALGQTFNPMDIEFEMKKDKKISDWFNVKK